MRITMFLIAGLLGTGAAIGQGFDPLQGVKDGLLINEAIPAIAANVGPLSGMDAIAPNMLPAEGDSPLMRITADYGGSIPAMFIFCDGRLIAFDSPISEDLADSLTASIGVDPAAEKLEIDGNVRVRLADGKTQITYFNPPGAAPWIDLLHPYLSFQVMNFDELCTSG